MKGNVTLLIILICSISVSAQEIEISDIYPILKKTENRRIKFEGCVDGDCRSGKGTYMTISGNTTGSGRGVFYRAVTIYIYSGEFYQNGLKLVGTEYGLNTRYEFKSGAKKMDPTYDVKLDGSDPALNKFRNYEGEFKFNKGTYQRHGDQGIVHYMLKKEEYTSYVSDYYNGYMNRRYITYNDDQPYKAFEGWMQAGQRFMIGKLTYQNGDVYQGTFFDDKHEGWGRLRTSEGVVEGLWEAGKLVMPEKITIPEVGLNGNLSNDERLYIKFLMYDGDEKSCNYYGEKEDDIPSGQGLAFNYWGHINSGNFKSGQLHGKGFRLTTQNFEDLGKYGGYYPHIKEVGIFTDGVLTEGIRVKYKFKKNADKYFYSETGRETVVPSAAIVTQNAVAEEVTITGSTENEWFSQASQLLSSEQYAKALYMYQYMIPRLSFDNRPSALAAFCSLMLKDIKSAEKYLEQAQQLNPTDHINYAVASYLKMAEDDMAAAKEKFDEAMWFHSQNNIAEITSDLPLMIKAGINPGGVKALQEYIIANYSKRDKSYLTLNKKMENGVGQIGLDNSAARQYFDEGIKMSSQIKDKPWLKMYAQYVAGASFYYNGLYDEAKPYLDQAYLSLEDPGADISSYVNLFVYVVLAEYASNSGNHVDSYLSSALQQISELGDLGNDLKAKYYDVKSKYFMAQGDNEGLKTSADQLLKLKNTGFDEYYNAQAYNYLGNAYGVSIDASSRSKSKDYYERALAIAEKNNYEPLLSDVQANLAISYWQGGEKQKARDTYEKSAAKSLGEGRYADAEISMNNLAYLYFYEKDYMNAAKYFKKAVDVTEQARKNLSVEDRVTFFEGKISAYQGLIYSLAKQNKVAEVFEAQQKDRARVLLENLIDGEVKASASLPEFQQTLKSGELAVFYSLFEAGEVVITTVTNSFAHVKVVDEKGSFLSLKGQYLDQINKGKPGYSPINIAQAKRYNNTEDRIASQFNMADFNGLMELLRGLIDKSIDTPNDEVRNTIMNQLLSQYYQFLIKPIQAEMTLAKDLILFPDGILNFLPFEAVKPTGGPYLVQQWKVRYGRSADVSLALSNRKYSNNRKSFLGMGGAEYNQMSEFNGVDRENLDYGYLKIKTALNARNNQSQREIYASLFGPKMDYLEGTLKEVNNLSQIFNDATVYRGTDMTENLVKELSKSGQLKNYKIIHLATHGFSLPDFPQLSGVAMTIFPVMRNGEDGYLTAPEIAKLDMNADMVVLSACETALGKIYGGEGVAGLTQSLLEGGANAAMVSLWPVNDAGTMYFMTGLYQLTEKQGMSYPDAVNEMKRRFISGEFGEFFADPQIWAPFIHYGY